MKLALLVTPIISFPLITLIMIDVFNQRELKKRGLTSEDISKDPFEE